MIAQCDKEAKNPKFEVKGNDLLILSDGNCGKFNNFAKFLDDNNWVISICLIVFGVVLLFFGGSKWDTLLTSIGFILGAAGILVLIFGFVQIKASTQNYVIVGIIALIIGILVAALCKSFVVLSYFLLGFFGGYILSIYLLLMFHFQGELWLYYLIKFGSGIILGLFCLGIKKWSLAIVTAVIGGFLVSYFIGFALKLLHNLGDII